MGWWSSCFDGGVVLQDAIEVLERSMIQGALDEQQRKSMRRRKQLGIHRNTLQRKMVEYGIGNGRTRPRRKPAGSRGADRGRRRTRGVRPMDLLIFDLDGTLIDSRLDLANAVNATRRHMGMEPSPTSGSTPMWATAPRC